MTRLVIEHRGKRYRVLPKGICTKSAYSLYQRGVCDYSGEDKGWPKSFPCDNLRKVIASAGLIPGIDVHFKEAAS